MDAARQACFDYIVKHYKIEQSELRLIREVINHRDGSSPCLYRLNAKKGLSDGLYCNTVLEIVYNMDEERVVMVLGNSPMK